MPRNEPPFALEQVLASRTMNSNQNDQPFIRLVDPPQQSANSTPNPTSGDTDASTNVDFVLRDGCGRRRRSTEPSCCYRMRHSNSPSCRAPTKKVAPKVKCRVRGLEVTCRATSAQIHRPSVNVINFYGETGCGARCGCVDDDRRVPINAVCPCGVAPEVRGAAHAAATLLMDVV